MALVPLERASGRPGRRDTRKYRLVQGGGDGGPVCGQGRLEDSGYDTRDWLRLDAVLKAGDRSGIIVAVIDGEVPVVLKIGSGDAVRREEGVASRLAACGAPGFVRLCCAFQCDDDFRRHVPAGVAIPVHARICDAGRGPHMHVLVMPHFHLGSVQAQDWSLRRAGAWDDLVLCLRHGAASLLAAYMRCGLVYSDSHLDNLMLSEVPREAGGDAIDYGEGLRPVDLVSAHDGGDRRAALLWIDLENAQFDATRDSPGYAFGAVRNMLMHAQYDLGLDFDGMLEAQALLGDLERGAQFDATRFADHAREVDAAIDAIRATGPRRTRSLVYDPTVV